LHARGCRHAALLVYGRQSVRVHATLDRGSADEAVDDRPHLRVRVPRRQLRASGYPSRRPVPGAPEVTMQMNAYLSFRGNCEEAFTFYADCLDGRLGEIFRYGGTPLAAQVPSDWVDKVMHSSLTVGSQVFMGGDVAPDRYEKPAGFSLSLHIDSTT